jgi:cytochrome c2
MPSFAQNYGGPLREDQIRDIAAFIINWSATAQAIEPPTAPTGPLAGTDITKVLPEGNAANGEALATSLGCTACHAIQGGAGPYWPASGDQAGIGDRAGTRITQSDYTGAAETAEQYLFESVVNTSIYLVAGYGDGLMPKTYGSTLTEQDMADLIAYLLTIK